MNMNVDNWELKDNCDEVQWYYQSKRKDGGYHGGKAHDGSETAAEEGRPAQPGTLYLPVSDREDPERQWEEHYRRCRCHAEPDYRETSRRHKDCTRQ